MAPIDQKNLKNVRDDHNYSFTAEMIEEFSRLARQNQLSSKPPVSKKTVERRLAGLDNDHIYDGSPLPIYPEMASSSEVKKLFCFNQCEICNKFFFSKGSLKNHANIHDKGRRIYKCDLCDYRSVYLGNVKNHKTIHTGLFYQCTLCWKLFHLKSSLNRHQTLVHRPK